MLETLTHEVFAKHLQSDFELRLDDGDPIVLTLHEVKTLEGSDAKDRMPFSVIFNGPKEPVLEQAIYALEHPDMGDLGLFLVPLMADAQGAQYEAVFT